LPIPLGNEVAKNVVTSPLTVAGDLGQRRSAQRLALDS
jgi:hypothetical protein